MINTIVLRNGHGWSGNTFDKGCVKFNSEFEISMQIIKSMAVLLDPHIRVIAETNESRSSPHELTKDCLCLVFHAGESGKVKADALVCSLSAGPFAQGMAVEIERWGRQVELAYSCKVSKEEYPHLKSDALVLHVEPMFLNKPTSVVLSNRLEALASRLSLFIMQFLDQVNPKQPQVIK